MMMMMRVEKSIKKILNPVQTQNPTRRLKNRVFLSVDVSLLTTGLRGEREKESIIKYGDKSGNAQENAANGTAHSSGKKKRV